MANIGQPKRIHEIPEPVQTPSPPVETPVPAETPVAPEPREPVGV